jgi:trehalose 6-phosphate synthase
LLKLGSAVNRGWAVPTIPHQSVDSFRVAGGRREEAGLSLGDRTRQALSRAAVRSQQRQGMPPRTTRADLVEWARAHLPERRLVVVSNREPYSHERTNGDLRVVRNAGGLTVALDAVMQALGGVWVAHGSGNADREVVDANDRVPTPPDRPRYLLRRVWLTPEDHARYYSGFANSALWPLCHIVYVRPVFRLDDWNSYVEVNRKFAEAALEEMGDAQGLVFIQDYHLALAARFIRERRPDLQVALFWHIPWPNAEVFRVLPWRRELLEGMLANDVVGFHIRRHAMNFLESVAETLEARVDHEHLAVERGGRRTWVRPFAISVDADEIGALVETAEVRTAEREIRDRLGLDGCKVGLGVDRLDYTKGIPERLEALERLFEKHPEWIGSFAFIQIGVPSRIELPQYRAVQAHMRRLANRINRRFPREGGETVHVIEANLDFRELLPYYRMADICAVTSLHDGMNLVAKEYLAASPDLEGALVLSPFTGAARELERAWIASPYDREGLADAYHDALSATPEARAERMAALRETVLRHNVFDWTLDVLDTIVGLNLRTPVPEASQNGGRSE